MDESDILQVGGVLDEADDETDVLVIDEEQMEFEDASAPEPIPETSAVAPPATTTETPAGNAALPDEKADNVADNVAATAKAPAAAIAAKGNEDAMETAPAPAARGKQRVL